MKMGGVLKPEYQSEKKETRRTVAYPTGTDKLIYSGYTPPGRCQSGEEQRGSRIQN